MATRYGVTNHCQTGNNSRHRAFSCPVDFSEVGVGATWRTGTDTQGFSKSSYGQIRGSGGEHEGSARISLECKAASAQRPATRAV